MVQLKKEDTLLARDGEGKLLPVEITLPLSGKPTIRVLPITRGEFADIHAKATDGKSSRQEDDEIIVKYCLEPKYTLEEAKDLKAAVSTAIVTSIIEVSIGYKSKDEVSRISAVEEEELKKN